mmetsp:Transcript_21203/g.33286  ORF Transcript_21203/g.33286 Transcript_21203/m.33286 type:complete len:322 (+) Transcript_21203:225-1190(+)
MMCNSSTSMRRRNVAKSGTKDDLDSPEEKHRSVPVKGDSSDNDEVVDKNDIQQKWPPAPTTQLDHFLYNCSNAVVLLFGFEQILKISQYSFWAVSYLIASVPKRHAEPLCLILDNLYDGLNSLRYLVRIAYGLLFSLEALRTGSWAEMAWDDPKIDMIYKYPMAGSMICYFSLELVSLAGCQMPELVNVNVNWIAAMSCRFWCVCTISEIWGCYLKLKELELEVTTLRELLAEKKKNDDKEGFLQIEHDIQYWMKQVPLVKLQILRDLLFILPAVSWSLPTYHTSPLLSDFNSNGLLFLEACVHACQLMYRATLQPSLYYA